MLSFCDERMCVKYKDDVSFWVFHECPVSLEVSFFRVTQDTVNVRESMVSQLWVIVKMMMWLRDFEITENMEKWKSGPRVDSLEMKMIESRSCHFERFVHFAWKRVVSLRESCVRRVRGNMSCCIIIMILVRLTAIFGHQFLEDREGSLKSVMTITRLKDESLKQVFQVCLFKEIS